MIAPVRIQLRRAAGWRMPRNTVKVDRSTKWGNPFRVKDIVWLAVAMGFRGDLAGRRAAAVELHRRWLGLPPKDGPMRSAVQGVATNIQILLNGNTIECPAPPTIAEIVAELRGKDIGCWCGADGPCHGDTLLEIANREVAA
ncbi:protein of unknown function [Sphingomonas sp. YR710]|uniref:DUF4326 domain-containing protein n=1 Tax=Sphingomonas sp. YR710 TaxID=1882773 RepID=UPI00087F113F|nr:DUF4326 domain-containing protein [Sphingomonas sp. YR710]SDC30369.1 protein of unknown function [Sphingomonas sp. YR710]